MSALAGPPPVDPSPLRRIAGDLRAERAAKVPFPPGDTWVSVKRTRQMLRDPLTLLLDAYERHGPIFTLRVFHGNVVFMLGPEANHHMLVSHAHNFTWRDGHLGDLIPFLGDGLLTIDGEFHRRSRQIMLPAFHRERILAAHAIMEAETEAALDAWRPGTRVDVYQWTREVALRIAMRALFGLDPDRTRDEVDAAHEFEAALAFYSRDYFLQTLRGPGTPYRRLLRARGHLDRIVFAEIRRRRAVGEEGQDVLSLLIGATDEEGDRLSDQHIRDEVMTLLFAGHDTTTSTVAFLFHELAREPKLVDDPGFDLSTAVDETLRLYPPAWIGPRRSIEPYEFSGVSVPGGVPVEYCSWASHRLPDVWDHPDVFRPGRFAPGNREAIPKGAYVPFGGGSRTCIGMRFGQAEIAIIAGGILERFRLELDPGYRLRVRQSPTIGPRDGMPMTVRAAA